MVRSIILSKKDRGEADELVVFLTREGGWLRGIAKNAKKSRQRFGGHLEPLTLVDLLLRPRKKDNLIWIDEAHVAQGLLGIRSDLGKVALATYFLELAQQLLPEAQSDAALFDFMVGFLESLEGALPAPAASLLEEIRLLGLLGYAPEFHICPACAKKIDPGEEAFFSPVNGGVIHSGCAGRIPTDLVISPDTLALVRRGLALRNSAASRLKLSKRGATEVRAALSSFVRHLSGQEIKSLAFLEKVAAWPDPVR
ncbi:MAG: DNA repair protein RecO [Deltaproteobacteria bacterium]|nr:DNA repair protein RecO [Deltaproteobacteria bacterium]